MSDYAKQFVDQWVSENVRATGYQLEGDKAENLANQCWKAADGAGVSRMEIKTSCGSLVDYMAAAVEALNRSQVNRLASKHD